MIVISLINYINLPLHIFLDSKNIPIRNASRHSNITPPVPPPMPEISFRKDSQGRFI